VNWASWQAGRLTHYPGLAALFPPLYEDREMHGLCLPHQAALAQCLRDQNGAARSSEDGKFGNIPNGIYEDSLSNLVLGAELGLWRWKPGPPRPLPDQGWGGIAVK